MSHRLIVDDEPGICWALKKLAESLGHTARTAASAEQALRETERTPKPEIVFLDVRLPGVDGISAMPQLCERLPDVPIIGMTAHGQLETAVEAIRAGAFEYLTKPFDLVVAEKVLDRALVLKRRGGRVSEPAAVPGLQNQIIGHSPALKSVFKQIALVTGGEACVLVTGESGTGKELVARAIHRYSRRGSGLFVPVHVAALSPTFRCRCRSSCCGLWNTARSFRWVPISRGKLIFDWFRPRTEIYRNTWRMSRFVTICFSV